MSGAFLSTGWMATSALQYSPSVGAAATVAAVTVAPLVGRPMAEAGIVPLSCSQVAAAAAPAGENAAATNATRIEHTDSWLRFMTVSPVWTPGKGAWTAIKELLWRTDPVERRWRYHAPFAPRQHERQNQEPSSGQSDLDAVDGRQRVEQAAPLLASVASHPKLTG